MANVKNSAVATDVANTVEKAKLEISALKSGRSDGQITDDEAGAIIAGFDKEGIIREDTDGSKYILTSKNNKVLVSSIWEGTVTAGTQVGTTENGTSGSGTSENGTSSTGSWVANEDNTEFTYGSGDTAVTLKIGDYINYKSGTITYKSPAGTYISGSYASLPTNSDGTQDTLTYGTGCSSEQPLSDYDGGWRVLGVDNGNLQLISADSIKTLYLGGYTGYKYGAEELNNICSKYGNSNTINARSVNVDDIDKVTGYNPNNVGVKDIAKSGTGTKYASGYSYEYGNDVTYAWGTSNSDIKYTYGTNGSGSYDNSKYGTYGFNYFDITGRTWLTNTFSSGAHITTLKSTYYYYYPYTLTNSSSTSGSVVGIDTASSAYKTLFCGSSGSTNIYWLASPYVYASGDGANGVGFGLRLVDYGRVADGYLIGSDGYLFGIGRGVRPVVTLKSGVTISKGDKGGTSKDDAYTLNPATE